MKKILFCFCILILCLFDKSSAEITLGDIQRFYPISDDNALLAIPRRKIHLNSDSVYIFHQSAGSSTRLWVHSSDKGLIWDTVGIGNQDGNIGGDYYDSHFHSWYAEGMHFCTGQATNVPLWYRYINKPVQAGTDKEDQIILDSRHMNWVPTIVASSADEIWIVARYSADSLVYYHTTDRFQTVSHKGFIGNVNLKRIDMRIGSCMDESGNAIFVSLMTGVGGGQDGYYYWQWDDTEQDFVGRSDSAIAIGNIGMPQRGWSINYIKNRLHLVYADAPWQSGTTYIHHYYQDGIGGWTHDTASVIDAGIGILSYPIITSRADSLYLFYIGNSEITMKIFDLNSLQWQSELIIVAPSNEPSRSVQVPQTIKGDYIPVAWINRTTKILSYRSVDFSTNILDSDNDGILNDQDNCPNLANPSQLDIDLDLIGDPCDNCPGTTNSQQVDTDGDTIGDLCDNCPLHSNSLQEDFNLDNIGDACCCNDRRGNVNGIEPIDVSDLVFLVSYQFTGGNPPQCILTADLNNSGEIDIADLIYMVNFAFQNGPAPIPCEE